jgi:pimeloyl-ACP methyl ester carboxylesterase
VHVPNLLSVVAGFIIFLSTSVAVPAQDIPRPATPPSNTLQTANTRQKSRLRADTSLSSDCPNYSGPLSSIGVPVGQSVVLVVLSGPAPEGGITWNVFSSDPSIVAAGNATQGFIPEVFTPEGQHFSSPFTLFGVSVGQTNLIIQEVSPGSGEFPTPMTAWAVNPGNDSSFLDANFSYNTCRTEGSPSLSGDPNILSTCGGNVEGTVSDGLSQLLLRIVSGLQGTACYAITSTSPPDQGSITTAVTTTQTAGGLEYGFSLYQAPAEYGDSSDSRQVQIQFSFAPNIGNSNTTTITAPLTVIRPPVVLIHGLWSNPTAWPSIWDRPGPYYVNSRADYHATNASSFSVNFPTVQTFVANGLQQVRDLGFAATQADVVGHSMGGLLTRLYAGSSAFQRPDNFNMGDVRRLITLDTPHFGASTANLIVSMNANSVIFRAVADVFLGGLGFPNILPFPIQNGAVCDLAENSPALQGLSGGTNLPTQVITATGGPPGAPSGGLYLAPLETTLTAQSCFPLSPLLPVCIPFYIFPQDIVNGFRFRQSNDAIVPLSSQQAGVGGINFASYIHTSVTGGQDVANQTFQLLDGPSSGFAVSLPPVPSDGLGNPLTVPGRGATLDQQDYAGQCIGASAPLKPQALSSLTEREAREPTQVLASTKNRIQRNSAAKSLASDPRVQVSSPANGQKFAPGASVNITVQLTSPLTATTGFVAVTVPGLGPLVGTNYNGTSYLASFVIPATFAGPLTITPVILDSNNNPIQGVPVTIDVVPTSAPLSLSLLGGTYFHLTSVPSTASIHVTGNYANNLELDLTSSVAGTSYSSSNTNVLTVDSEGNVQTVAFGTAVVTVQNSGLKAFATFVIESATSAVPPQDVSSDVNISLSGFQLNRNTGFYVQTVNLTNSLAVPVPGPLYFVITGLPSSVTLSTAGGGQTRAIQPTGSSYIKLQLPDGLTLQPGASISLTLQFLNLSRVRISYTPKVFRTLGTP